MFVSEALEGNAGEQEKSKSKAGESAGLTRLQGKRGSQRQEGVSQEKALLGGSHLHQRSQRRAVVR